MSMLLKKKLLKKDCVIKFWDGSIILFINSYYY